MSELYNKPLFCCAIHNRFVGCRMGRYYAKRDRALAFCGIVTGGAFACSDDGSSTAVYVDRDMLGVTVNGVSGGSSWMLTYKKNRTARLELPVFNGEESWEFYVSAKPFDPEMLFKGCVKLGDRLYRSVWPDAPIFPAARIAYPAYGLPCSVCAAASY